MSDTGVVHHNTFPLVKKRRLPDLQTSLVLAGCQVCKVPSAPAKSRFERVPGGWRPLRRQEPVTPTSPSSASGDPSPVPPCWSIPQRVQAPESSVGTLTLGRLALSRPDGLEREKQPYRRNPHLVKALHQWPKKFLQEQEEKLAASQAAVDALDSASEELKTLPKRDGSGVSSSSSRRSYSPAPAPSHSHSHLRRGSLRRGSVADLAEKLRRSSMASLCISEAADSESAGEHCAAARQAAEAAQAEAEEQRLPAALCRQRRLQVYAEALLKEPVILQVERRRGGGGLEELDEVDLEVEKLIKEDISELAALFAEFDGSLEGILQQHDVRSLMRLLGRSLSEDELQALLKGLEDQTGTSRDIGFREFVELCDMRLHSEKLYLRAFFRDRFRGASSSCIQPHLRDVAEALQGVKVHVRPEQVERTAMELGQAVWAEFVTLVNETDLFLLAQRCRLLEKQRAWERAGFTLEQVSRFQELFDYFSGKTRRGLRAEELLYIVHQLGMTPKSRSDEADMEATAYNGKDRSETMSFEECLHAARRFLDKKEMDARLKELRAAAGAGIPQDDLEYFRAFYKQLILEDSQGNKKDFTYFALCRGVQIMGATLTVERNAELEQLFREHAVSSGSSSHLHLPFPKFIVMIGILFKSDFASLRTCAATLQEDMQLRRASVGKVVKTFSTGKFLMRARLGAR